MQMNLISTPTRGKNILNCIRIGNPSPINIELLKDKYATFSVRYDPKKLEVLEELRIRDNSKEEPNEQGAYMSRWAGRDGWPGQLRFVFNMNLSIEHIPEVPALSSEQVSIRLHYFAEAVFWVKGGGLKWPHQMTSGIPLVVKMHQNKYVSLFFSIQDDDNAPNQLENFVVVFSISQRPLGVNVVLEDQKDDPNIIQGLSDRISLQIPHNHFVSVTSRKFSEPPGPFSELRYLVDVWIHSDGRMEWPTWTPPRPYLLLTNVTIPKSSMKAKSTTTSLTVNLHGGNESS